MLKKALIALVVVAAGLAGVVSMQPDTFEVSRSVQIAAPPEAVFAQVNDFHNWAGWSPWEKLDPAMKKTFGGPGTGTGATYAWVGNSDVGEGKMTITGSRPAERVAIKLEFIKPFASTSDTEFLFRGQDGGTAVSWTMRGGNNFISKAFCLVMGGMDKMIGPDFEKGLAAMKAVAEARR